MPSITDALTLKTKEHVYYINIFFNMDWILKLNSWLKPLKEADRLLEFLLFKWCGRFFDEIWHFTDWTLINEQMCEYKDLNAFLFDIYRNFKLLTELNQFPMKF